MRHLQGERRARMRLLLLLPPLLNTALISSSKHRCALTLTITLTLTLTSLYKHMGDGKVKLGQGPYAISTAILSMYAGFQPPGTKYMLAPVHRKQTFLCGVACGFAKLSIWTICHNTYKALNLGYIRFKIHDNILLGSAIHTINLLWPQLSVLICKTTWKNTCKKSKMFGAIRGAKTLHTCLE